MIKKFADKKLTKALLWSDGFSYVNPEIHPVFYEFGDLKAPGGLYAMFFSYITTFFPNAENAIYKVLKNELNEQYLAYCLNYTLHKFPERHEKCTPLNTMKKASGLEILYLENALQSQPMKNEFNKLTTDSIAQFIDNYRTLNKNYPFHLKSHWIPDPANLEDL